MPRKKNTDKQMNKLLDRLLVLSEGMERHLSDWMCSDTPDIDGISKIGRVIAAILENIHKIKHGRAAQELITSQILDLQRHLEKVNKQNAERERRKIRKPLVQIIGRMDPESDLVSDDISSEDEPERLPDAPRRRGSGE